MISYIIKHIEKVLYLLFIYSIYYIIINSINNIILLIIPNNILLIILEIIIVIIQVDNFSLLYDYNDLKKYYIKLKEDEYRIKKLTNISNKLLRKYESLEEDYFSLLSEYNENNDNNMIKTLKIELSKYYYLYNLFTCKINKEIKKSHSLNDIYKIYQNV